MKTRKHAIDLSPVNGKDELSPSFPLHALAYSRSGLAGLRAAVGRAGKNGKN